MGVTTHPVRQLAAAAPTGLPVVRNLVRRTLGHAFGPPGFDPTSGAGDPGLYGPGSASWRVIAEPAAIVGGVRALVVQLLHPLAMAGVADHSSFRTDPLGRLRRTSSYVTTTVLGSTDEALAAARTIRRVHRHVRGIAPDGRAYTADDPHLLVWVSIALTSSFLATDAAYAPHPLTGDDADAFVDEQARGAALLDPQVDVDALDADPAARRALVDGTLPLPLRDEGALPRTVAELEAALGRFEPELAVNAQGREAFAFLRWPPIGALRAGYLPLLAGALATLDPEQRALLGLPRSQLAAGSVRAQTRVLLGGLRLATGTSPAARAAERRATQPAAARAERRRTA